MSKCNKCNAATSRIATCVDVPKQSRTEVLINNMHDVVDIFSEESKGKNRLWDHFRFCPSGHVSVVFCSRGMEQHVHVRKDMSNFVNNVAFIYHFLRKLDSVKDMEGKEHDFINSLGTPEKLHEDIDSIKVAK